MKDKVQEYLESEEGIRNAERFIKAAKEYRLIASVKHVSSSGMSRDIFFGEVVHLKDCTPPRYAIYQFSWFFKNLGFRLVDKDGRDLIRVGGCGMNMVFHTFYTALSILKSRGFDVPDNWSVLADDYMSV